MRLIIGILLLVVLFSCSMENPVDNNTPGCLETTNFSGEIIGEGAESVYRQSLEIEMDNVLDYSIKLNTITGESEDWTLDEEGYYLENGDCKLKKTELSFEFPLRNGKLVNAIEFIELSIRYEDLTEEEIRLGDRRLIGTLILDPEDLIVGNCYQFSISEDISNLLEDGMYAHHFMYRLNITDLSGNLIANGEWYNSINMQDIRKLKLTDNSEPALTGLGDEELYELEVYVVTRSGYADIDNPASLSFACTGEENFPETLIYNGIDPFDESIDYCRNVCWVLNEYHYDLDIPYFVSNEANFELPSEMVEGEKRYAVPFNINLANEYCVIGSDELKVYLQWGYWGQYGHISQVSNMITNSPYDEEIRELCNQNHEYYGAEVCWYEIQLDGNAPETDYHGAAAEEVNPGWLRIRDLHPNSNRICLEGLSYGEHVFRVRVIDNFGNIDPEPAEFNFNIYEYVEPEERTELLILDLDRDNTIFCPDDVVDQIYQDALESYNGEIVEIDMWENSLSPNELVTNNYKIYYDESKLLARSDLMAYKWIIIHNDHYNNSNLQRISHNLYDIHTQGSNLVLSSGDNLIRYYEHSFLSSSIKSEIVMEDYWGLDISEEYPAIECVSHSLLTNPFMIGADAVNGMTARLDLELDEEEIWCSMVSIRQGLGPCCIFMEENIDSQVLYRYDCKPVDAPVSPPSQEEYDYLNEKPVAIHNTHAGSEAWIFGFGLSFMEIEDLQDMFYEIFSEER